jgi:hypothetical protein
LSDWINISGSIPSNQFIVLPTNPAAFYQIMGQ